MVSVSRWVRQAHQAASNGKAAKSLNWFVFFLTRYACHLLTATLQWVSGSHGLQGIPDSHLHWDSSGGGFQVIPDSLLLWGFCQAQALPTSISKDVAC